MRELNDTSFAFWANEQEKINERGYRVFPGNLNGLDSPWGKVELKDEYRDYSNYFWVVEVDGRNFQICGYYDSYEGVELYGNEEWEEVQRLTRTEEYWGPA